MRKTLLVVALAIATAGCGTLRPPKLPELPGQAASPARRFLASVLTRASMGDEVFLGASVESVDGAALAGGILSGALASKSAELGALGSVLEALIQARQIESSGPRAWAVTVAGDPAGSPPRWFVVRRDTAGIAALPAGAPVRIYARRVELPGISALIVSRWVRL